MLLVTQWWFWGERLLIFLCPDFFIVKFLLYLFCHLIDQLWLLSKLWKHLENSKMLFKHSVRFFKNHVKNVSVGEKENQHSIFMVISVLNMQCEIMYILWIWIQRPNKLFAAYLDAESLRNNNLLNSSSSDKPW